MLRDQSCDKFIELLLCLRVFWVLVRQTCDIHGIVDGNHGERINDTEEYARKSMERPKEVCGAVMML